MSASKWDRLILARNGALGDNNLPQERQKKFTTRFTYAYVIFIAFMNCVNVSSNVVLEKRLVTQNLPSIFTKKCRRIIGVNQKFFPWTYLCNDWGFFHEKKIIYHKIHICNLRGLYELCECLFKCCLKNKCQFEINDLPHH